MYGWTHEWMDGWEGGRKSEQRKCGFAMTMEVLLARRVVGVVGGLGLR